MSGKKLKVAFEIHPTASKCFCGPQSNIRSPIPQRRYAAYAATEGDWDAIFGKVRCRRCV